MQAAELFKSCLLTRDSSVYSCDSSTGVFVYFIRVFAYFIRVFACYGRSDTHPLVPGRVTASNVDRVCNRWRIFCNLHEHCAVN